MAILCRLSKRWKSLLARSNAYSIISFMKVKSLQNCRTYSSGSRPMTSLGAALARTLAISANFAACWARRTKAIASLFSTWPRKWQSARGRLAPRVAYPALTDLDPSEKVRLCAIIILNLDRTSTHLLVSALSITNNSVARWTRDINVAFNSGFQSRVLFALPHVAVGCDGLLRATPCARGLNNFNQD